MFEKEAERCAEAYVKENCDDSLSSFRGSELQKAFLAGLKTGRPKWHKVSEQVPTDVEKWCEIPKE